MKRVATGYQRWLAMVAAILGIVCLATLSPAPHAWAGSSEPSIAPWPTATPTLAEASPVAPPASARPPLYAYDTLGAARSAANVGPSVEGASPHARAGGSVSPASNATADAATTLGAPTRTPRAADDLAGLADDYIDITAKGSRVRNVQTSVSRSSFEQNLIEAGYRPTVVSSGKNVVSYELNGTRYVVRDAATSTGGPTADFYPAGSSSFTLKVRLGG